MSERRSDYLTEQPAPVPNETRPVWELVIEDMRARDAQGRARYGTPLQVGNGRDMLADAYQEALDLVVYLRAAIEETRRAEERNAFLIEHFPVAIENPDNLAAFVEAGRVFAEEFKKTRAALAAAESDTVTHVGVWDD